LEAASSSGSGSAITITIASSSSTITITIASSTITITITSGSGSPACDAIYCARDVRHWYISSCRNRSIRHGHSEFGTVDIRE